MGFIFWIGLSFGVGILGSKKSIGFGWAFFWSILLSPLIGLIIVLASNPPKVHKYKEHKELGEKEEFKGNYSKAIDHYLDAIYYLEKDYKSLKGNDEKKRTNLVEDLRDKINFLEFKIEQESEQ